MQYDALMRTTIDLPDDLHQLAVALSRDLRQSLSVTVEQLVRRGLDVGQVRADSAEAGIQLLDGFPVLLGSRPTTTENVRGLDDEA